MAAEVFEEDEVRKTDRKSVVLIAALQGNFPCPQVDVAIIGAGPAGTLLAYLLAEQYGKRATR